MYWPGTNRQTQAWEQRALADLRDGDPTAAIAAYAEHGRIHPAPADQLPDRIVDDYLRHVDEVQASQPDGEASERVVMLAVRRDDVTELNATTRDRLVQQGRLGDVALTTETRDGEREYRSGDRVLVTANDHHTGVLNGTRARVVAVDPEAGTMRLATEDRQTLTVDADWPPRTWTTVTR